MLRKIDWGRSLPVSVMLVLLSVLLVSCRREIPLYSPITDEVFLGPRTYGKAVILLGEEGHVFVLKGSYRGARAGEVLCPPKIRRFDPAELLNKVPKIESFYDNYTRARNKD
jgi:hypothetical protein